MLKLNSDKLATIFGIAIALGQVLGQNGIVSQQVSVAIVAVASALLGFVTNKAEKN